MNSAEVIYASNSCAKKILLLEFFQKNIDFVQLIRQNFKYDLKD